MTAFEGFKEFSDATKANPHHPTFMDHGLVHHGHGRYVFKHLDDHDKRKGIASSIKKHLRKAGYKATTAEDHQTSETTLSKGDHHVTIHSAVLSGQKTNSGPKRLGAVKSITSHRDSNP